MIKLLEPYRAALQEAQSRYISPITRRWEFEDLYSLVSGIWLVALFARHTKDIQILDRYLEYLDYIEERIEKRKG